MQRPRRSILSSLILVVAILLTTTSAHAAGGTYTYIACANPDTGMGVMSTDGALPPGFTGFYSHTVGPAAKRIKVRTWPHDRRPRDWHHDGSPLLDEHPGRRHRRRSPSRAPLALRFGAPSCTAGVGSRARRTT